jgi:hypothetical protein
LPPALAEQLQGVNPKGSLLDHFKHHCWQQSSNTGRTGRKTEGHRGVRTGDFVGYLLPEKEFVLEMGSRED